MKIKIKLLIFFWISTAFVFSQNLQKVDKIVTNYPHKITNPQKLADRINRDFKTDIEKARAIYTWIAQNIEYDVKTYYSDNKKSSFSYRTKEEKIIKEKKYSEKVVRNTLRNSKAICHGYATLFKKICDLTALESEFITGSTKNDVRDIGRNPGNSNHAWNAVKIDNKWYLVDVTWGAGKVGNREFKAEFNDFYFMTDPSIFFNNHFPDNKKWLLTDKSASDYKALPLIYSDFYKQKFEIVLPVNGVINFSTMDTLTIKLKAYSDRFNYAYNNLKYSKKVRVTSENDIVTLLIPIQKRRGALTIYHNKKAILKFKLLP